jgi:hypothetical protein
MHNGHHQIRYCHSTQQRPGTSWWEPVLVLGIAELVPAGIFSCILWQHASDITSTSVRLLDRNTICLPKIDISGQIPEHQAWPSFLPHPSPNVVLTSALGFGCCVSSLVYRRQKEDYLQSRSWLSLSEQSQPWLIALGRARIAYSSAMCRSQHGRLWS